MPARRQRPASARSGGRRSSAYYGVTGGFSPLSISGMRFWQEADAITGLSDGAALATWSDASGNSNDYTGAATYKSSSGPNSLPCVRFNGSSDHLNKTGLTGDTSWTVFLVAKKQTNTGNSRGLWNTSANAQVYFDAATSATKFNWFSNQAAAAQDIGGDATVWSILVLRINTVNSVDVYHNGGTATNFDPNDAIGTNTARYLGATIGTSNFGDWDVYGYLEYDSALVASTINLVGNYLGGKTGITWSTAS